MKVPLILPNMMSPCQAMMTLQLILWLDMLMVMVLELLAVIPQVLSCLINYTLTLSIKSFLDIFEWF